MKKFAFLFLAAAWLTGSAHGHGRDSCCAPAPSCCPSTSCCDSGCDRPGLLDRLRGLFHRNDCGCQPACEVRHCAPTCAPSCAPSCDTGCGRKLFHRDHCAPSCAPTCAPVCKPACAPACPTSCDSCCDRPGLLDRLRARFHRHDCCDTCDGCCGVGGAPAKSGETITTPPKKLPGGTEKGGAGVGAPTGEVRIITPPTAPAAPPAITIPATPGIESRSPF